MSTMIVLNIRYLVQLGVVRKYQEKKYVNCHILALYPDICKRKELVVTTAFISCACT